MGKARLFSWAEQGIPCRVLVEGFRLGFLFGIPFRVPFRVSFRV